MSNKTYTMMSGLLACVLAHTISGHAIAADQETTGTVSLTTSTDNCLEPSDCSSKGDCDLAIRINGAAATMLLNALKKNVSMEPEMEKLGLPLYTSKDGNLSCLDEVEPFCDMRLDVAKGSLEPIPLCE